MAVYTEVADEELDAFIASYDIGALTSCKGIAEGVENSNYLVQTEAGRYILTLYEKRVAREGPALFPRADGAPRGARHLLSAARARPRGPDAARACRAPAALITFLDGISVRRASIEQCASLGEALARFHVAGESFPLSRAEQPVACRLGAAVRRNRRPRRHDHSGACRRDPQGA